MSRAKLTLSLNRAGVGKVELDGKPIANHVRSVRIHAKAGEITRADIELIGVDVEMDVPVDVTCRRPLGNVLRALTSWRRKR